MLDLGSIRESLDRDGAASQSDDHRDRAPCPDGDLRPVDVLLQPLDLDARAAQLLAVVRDATERVESQAKLQRLVQQERARTAELESTLAAIGDAVIVCDLEGNVALANPATHDVLAHARDPDLHRPAGGPRRPGRSRSAPRAAERQGPVELMLRSRPGRWLELSAFPVVDTPRQPLSGTIFLVRDVSAARETRRMREAFLGILRTSSARR